MNKKISINLALAIAIIAMTVTFSVTMILSQNIFDKTVSGVRQKEAMYAKLAEIDKTVREDFYTEINQETLYDMLGTGYMQGLGDTNARYYTPKQYVDYLGEQSGKVIGIGVDIIKETGAYPRIIRVYDASPAMEAGFANGYTIRKIGDTETKQLTENQINSLLRGEEGTSITLTVADPGENEKPAVDIQRRQYDLPTVLYATQPYNSKTGYVQITAFTEQTAAELRTAVEALQAREDPIDSLVIDLRNNNSTNVSAAVSVADVLCPAGALAYQKEKEGTATLLGTSDLKALNLPLVVLVNKNTAAAAELVAAEVREFGMGSLVGATTAGKGSIQCAPVRLSDGAAISYTVGMLLTGKENSFDGTGLVPDVEAVLKAEDEKKFYDLSVDNDTQIAKALEVARTLLGGGGDVETNVTSGAGASSQPQSASAAVSESDTAAAAG